MRKKAVIHMKKCVGASIKGKRLQPTRPKGKVKNKIG